MALFTWQSGDGNWDNPASWGIARIVNSTDEGTTAATDGTSTVTFSGATDLSGVAAGDTLQLVGTTEGKNSGEFHEVLTVNDGADTMTVTPTPSSTVGGLSWVISEDLPGANAATDDVVFPPESEVGVTVGLDQSTQGKFASITTYRGYDGRIAFRANQLYCSATTILHMGGGPMHIMVPSGGQIDQLTFLSPFISVHEQHTVASISSSDYILSLRIISSKVLGTHVSIADPSSGGADFTEGLIIAELPGEPVIPQYRHSSPCRDIGFMFMSAGYAWIDRSVRNLFLAGGRFEFRTWAKDVGGDWGQMTNVYQTGGHLIWKAGGGILGTAAVLGGHFDFSQDPDPKTIDTLRVFPGAEVSLTDRITVTNDFSTLYKSQNLGRGEGYIRTR